MKFLLLLRCVVAVVISGIQTYGPETYIYDPVSITFSSATVSLTKMYINTPTLILSSSSMINMILLNAPITINTTTYPLITPSVQITGGSSYNLSLSTTGTFTSQTFSIQGHSSTLSSFSSASFASVSIATSSFTKATFTVPTINLGVTSTTMTDSVVNALDATFQSTTLAQTTLNARTLSLSNSFVYFTLQATVQSYAASSSLYKNSTMSVVASTSVTETSNTVLNSRLTFSSPTTSISGNNYAEAIVSVSGSGYSGSNNNGYGQFVITTSSCSESTGSFTNSSSVFTCATITVNGNTFAVNTTVSVTASTSSSVSSNTFKTGSIFIGAGAASSITTNSWLSDTSATLSASTTTFSSNTLLFGRLSFFGSTLTSSSNNYQQSQVNMNGANAVFTDLFSNSKVWTGICTSVTFTSSFSSTDVTSVCLTTIVSSGAVTDSKFTIRSNTVTISNNVLTCTIEKFTFFNVTTQTLLTYLNNPYSISTTVVARPLLLKSTGGSINIQNSDVTHALSSNVFIPAYNATHLFDIEVSGALSAFTFKNIRLVVTSSIAQSKAIHSYTYWRLDGLLLLKVVGSGSLPLNPDISANAVSCPFDFYPIRLALQFHFSGSQAFGSAYGMNDEDVAKHVNILNPLLTSYTHDVHFYKSGAASQCKYSCRRTQCSVCVLDYPSRSSFSEFTEPLCIGSSRFFDPSIFYYCEFSDIEIVAPFRSNHTFIMSSNDMRRGLMNVYKTGAGQVEFVVSDVGIVPDYYKTDTGFVYTDDDWVRSHPIMLLASVSGRSAPIVNLTMDGIDFTIEIGNGYRNKLIFNDIPTRPPMQNIIIKNSVISSASVDGLAIFPDYFQRSVFGLVGGISLFQIQYSNVQNFGTFLSRYYETQTLIVEHCVFNVFYSSSFFSNVRGFISIKFNNFGQYGSDITGTGIYPGVSFFGGGTGYGSVVGNTYTPYYLFTDYTSSTSCFYVEGFASLTFSNNECSAHFMNGLTYKDIGNIPCNGEFVGLSNNNPNIHGMTNDFYCFGATSYGCISAACHMTYFPVAECRVDPSLLPSNPLIGYTRFLTIQSAMQYCYPFGSTAFIDIVDGVYSENLLFTSRFISSLKLVLRPYLTGTVFILGSGHTSNVIALELQNVHFVNPNSVSTAYSPLSTPFLLDLTLLSFKTANSNFFCSTPHVSFTLPNTGVSGFTFYANSIQSIVGVTQPNILEPNCDYILKVSSPSIQLDYINLYGSRISALFVQSSSVLSTNQVVGFNHWSNFLDLRFVSSTTVKQTICTYFCGGLYQGNVDVSIMRLIPSNTLVVDIEDNKFADLSPPISHPVLTARFAYGNPFPMGYLSALFVDGTPGSPLLFKIRNNQLTGYPIALRVINLNMTVLEASFITPLPYNDARRWMRELMNSNYPSAPLTYMSGTYHDVQGTSVSYDNTLYYDFYCNDLCSDGFRQYCKVDAAITETFIDFKTLAMAIQKCPFNDIRMVASHTENVVSDLRYVSRSSTGPLIIQTIGAFATLTGSHSFTPDCSAPGLTLQQDGVVFKNIDFVPSIAGASIFTLNPSSCNVSMIQLFNAGYLFNQVAISYFMTCTNCAFRQIILDQMSPSTTDMPLAHFLYLNSPFTTLTITSSTIANTITALNIQGESGFYLKSSSFSSSDNVIRITGYSMATGPRVADSLVLTSSGTSKVGLYWNLNSMETFQTLSAKTFGVSSNEMSMNNVGIQIVTLNMNSYSPCSNGSDQWTREFSERNPKTSGSKFSILFSDPGTAVTASIDANPKVNGCFHCENGCPPPPPSALMTLGVWTTVIIVGMATLFMCLCCVDIAFDPKPWLYKVGKTV